MGRLVVTEDETWWTVLGVTPQPRPIPGWEHTRGIDVPLPATATAATAATAGTLELTWDEVSSSVSIRHVVGGEVVVALFRELATLLTAAIDGESAVILLEYGADGVRGRTRIQVRPTLSIEDGLLRV